MSASHGQPINAAAWADRLAQRVDGVARRATLALGHKVITDTPQDSGLAQGNWQTRVGGPAGQVLERRGASPALAELAEVLSAPASGQPLFLCNLTPYIGRLEHGSSRQAPAGMVGVNLGSWQSLVNAALDEEK